MISALLHLHPDPTVTVTGLKQMAVNKTQFSEDVKLLFKHKQMLEYNKSLTGKYWNTWTVEKIFKDL